MTSKRVRVENSLNKIGALAFSFAKQQEKAVRRLSQRRRQRLTQRFEPHVVRPAQMNHRFIGAARKALRPSQTGIPVTGGLTVTAARYLKEIADVYGLIYQLLDYQDERQLGDTRLDSFAKRSLYRLNSIYSLCKFDTVKSSWFIRRMTTRVNVLLRERRSLRNISQHNVLWNEGTALCAQGPEPTY